MVSREPRSERITVQFGRLEGLIPIGWVDISDDMPSDAPQTFARPDGIGALQFSAVTYVLGQRPRIEDDELRGMLAGALKAHALSPAVSAAWQNDEVRTVEAVVRDEGEVIVVWLITNGIDVVTATYTSLDPATTDTEREIREARAAVRLFRVARPERQLG